MESFLLSVFCALIIKIYIFFPFSIEKRYFYQSKCKFPFVIGGGTLKKQKGAKRDEETKRWLAEVLSIVLFAIS
jgi:hypothetical protein